MYFFKKSLIFSLSTLMVANSMSCYYGIKWNEQQNSDSCVDQDKCLAMDVGLEKSQSDSNLCLSDFSNSFLQDGCISNLADLLKRNTKLRDLNLSNDPMQQKKLRSIFNALNKEQCLQDLSLKPQERMTQIESPTVEKKSFQDIKCNFEKQKNSFNGLLKSWNEYKTNDKFIKFKNKDQVDSKILMLTEYIEIADSISQCDDIDENLHQEFLEVVERIENNVENFSKTLMTVDNFINSKKKLVKVKNSSSPKIVEKVEKKSESEKLLEVDVDYFNNCARKEYESIVTPTMWQSFTERIGPLLKKQSTRNFEKISVDNKVCLVYKYSDSGRIVFGIDADFDRNRRIIIYGVTENHDYDTIMNRIRSSK